MRSLTHALVFLAAVLLNIACGQMTPELKINVVCNPGVETCSPDLKGIDLAAETAAHLVGVNADEFKNNVYLAFNNGPVETDGGKYYGLCDTDAQAHMVTIQVEYTGSCVFAADNALLHEFVHGAFFFKTGDRDDAHASEIWHQVDGERAQLEKENCSTSQSNK